MALPELDTRSILNVVEENFKRVGLKTYAIRMIYIGEHAMPKEELIKEFQKNIKDVNSGYCEISVRGLLLLYDSYFVHIVEGSEDTVHRQLRFLFKRESDWIENMKKLDKEAAKDTESLKEITNEDEGPSKPERKMFKRLKLLIVYHSISTLLFDTWRAIPAHPPSLVGKLDVFGPLPEHMEQLRICLDKISRLCTFARTEHDLSFEGLSATDPRMSALPEVALLEYLLQSQYILDLRKVFHLHRRVDDYTFYFEKVWPVPTHFTPRLLYKLKIDDTFVDPLPVMPWETVKKEVEDEEKEEELSSSSD